MITFAEGIDGYSPSLSADQKRSMLWQQIQRTAYSNGLLPNKTPNLLKLLDCKSLLETFTASSDFLPSRKGKEKAIHTYGATALVTFEVNPELKRWTGMYETGGGGLLRFSLAKAGLPYTPGIGLKLLVDGQESVDFQAMYSLNGQGENQNPFANDFRNIVDPPEGIALKGLGLVFKHSIRAVVAAGLISSERELPISKAATVNTDGSTVQLPRYPYEITFVPNPELTKSLSANDPTDTRIKLQSISPGVVLYSVFGRESAASTGKFFIGVIKLESNFIASAFGDQELFFQHHLLEKALAK